jgi:hypothetical protein
MHTTNAEGEAKAPVEFTDAPEEHQPSLRRG